MSKKPNDGGPAFPLRAHNDQSPEYRHKGHPGMSLRDYFAGQAITKANINSSNWEKEAELAYYIADEMLKARERMQPNSDKLRDQVDKQKGVTQ